MSSSSLPDLGPWPTLGYTDSPLDRAALRRGEAAELARQADARAYLLGGELVAARPVAKGAPHDPLFHMTAAEALGGVSPVFLGLDAGAPRFVCSFRRNSARRSRRAACS